MPELGDTIKKLYANDLCSLDCDSLHPDDIKRLAQACTFLDKNKLVSVSIGCSNHYSGIGSKERASLTDLVCSLIRQHNTLTSLSLSGNKFNNVDIKSIITAVLETQLALKQFRLSYNHEETIGLIGAQALSSFINRNPTLKELYFDGNCLGIENLRQILTNNTVLHTISLECNRISPEVESLVSVLEGNPSLRKLRLARNELGPEGARIIANFLTRNNTVLEIDLSENNMGDAGAIALSDMLATNHALEEINLWGNKIGASGIIAIARALKANRTLRKIELGYNNIDSDGMTALATILTINSTLTHLELRHCKGIKDGDIQTLVNALKQNKAVKILDLEGVKIGATGAQALFELLQTNKSVYICLISCEIPEEIDERIDALQDKNMKFRRKQNEKSQKNRPKPTASNSSNSHALSPFTLYRALKGSATAVKNQLQGFKII